MATEVSGLKLKIVKSAFAKCARCWHCREDVGVTRSIRKSAAVASTTSAAPARFVTMPNAVGRFGRLSWLWLSLLVLVIDQASKFYFEGKLAMYQQIVVIPDYFSWTLAYNTGAAFSFLADSSGWQRWLFALIAVVVSAVLVVWLKRLGRNEPGWPSPWRWCSVVRWAICTTALPWAM
jgi:hypothetical protein